MDRTLLPNEIRYLNGIITKQLKGLGVKRQAKALGLSPSALVRMRKRLHVMGYIDWEKGIVPSNDGETSEAHSVKVTTKGKKAIQESKKALGF